MSATRNLVSSSLFAMPFLGYQPANVSNSEPALQAANIVKQTMLGAPFKWPWNRGEFLAQMDPDDAESWAQDFTVESNDFGFLEMAWLIDPETGKANEIEVRKVLAVESATQRPQSIAANLDDQLGAILIRLNAIPDAAYAIGGYYQKEPVLMSSMAALWRPIPDSLSYIYDWGFLAIYSMILKDARFPIYWQKFTSHLLGAQDGLTELERNIFLGNWLQVLTAPERASMLTQQGIQGRAI
jgi:hypothetical protein